MAAISPEMRQEPPDDHQGDTHPGQHGRGCKLDRPERPGSAGLFRHPTSLPSLAADSGFGPEVGPPDVAGLHSPTMTGADHSCP